MANRALTLDGVFEDWLRFGHRKAAAALGPAIAAAPVAELVERCRSLRTRTELPADMHADPAYQRGELDRRREHLVGEIAWAIRDAGPDADALLIELVDDPPPSAPWMVWCPSVCVAVLGYPRYDEASGRLPASTPAPEPVLRALAAHLRPNDRCLAPAVLAAELLGDASALDRFAAYDDGSPAFVNALIQLLGLAPRLSSGLITLVARHAASCQHCLSGPLTFEGDPDLLLELLERMPGEYLDESILIGLRRGMEPRHQERLAAFLATAPPRRFTAKLAKLAASKTKRGDTPKSLGVVATEGAPVLLGKTSALEHWQGALAGMPPQGDYHDACTSPGTLTRGASTLLVLSSHECRAELLDAGRGVRLIVLAGDPADAWAARATLPFEEIACDLGEGPHALLDAAFTFRAAKADADRYLAVSKKGALVRVTRATTAGMDVLRLDPVR